MRFFAVLLCLLVCLGSARAADPLVDNAVNALSQLTDPRRLTLLPEGEFRAQLGPALGWLNVARRQDVSPESVIVRALARNGLDGERARLTREALLRNLARADAWELFNHPESTRALAVGAPAPIPAGMHRGHLAQATVILPDGLSPKDRREFACLVLRADDETPPPTRRGSRRRQAGDLLARGGGNTVIPARRRVAASREMFSPPPAAATATRNVLPPTPPPATGDEDALPVAYATRGQDNGRIVVREELAVGQEVALGVLGGPARRFVWRGVDGGGPARFELLDGPEPRVFALPLTRERPANGASRAWTIYDEPGVMRIALYDGADGGTRTVLFEFVPGTPRK